MAIVSSEIKYYLTGGAGNTDPNLSLGGTISSTEAPQTIDQLYAAASPAEVTAGSIKYRAISVKNTDVSLTITAPVVFIFQETTGTQDTVAIAYDSGSTQTVADENTAPSAPALSFSTPLTEVSGIALGDMVAGASKRIWLRWTITAGATVPIASTGILRVIGGTPP